MTKKSTQKSDAIAHPHDHFFRESMKDQRVAIEFLETHLPADILEWVDLHTLVLQPRSQSNAIRRESTVDVLFKTKLRDKTAYIYLLLEHQSSPDHLMAFRVIQYTVNAIYEHLKRHKTRKIPMIYPLVVYHGRRCEWITNINDLVDAPRTIVDRYFLRPFDLIDLNTIDDETMKQKTWSGIMEFVMKHIFARDMLPFLRDILPLFKIVDQKQGRDFLGLVLQYALERAELSDESAFYELINTHISDEVGERVMTLAEKLVYRGKLEGKLEEKFKL